MTPPDGLDAIKTLFGDPAVPGFEADHIVSFDLPYPLVYGTAMVRKSRCHRLMVPVFQAALSEVKSEGFADRASHYGGIFAQRAIRGNKTGRLSTHSWGIAIDLNPAQNALGTFGRMHPAIIAIMGRHGFLWGGYFKRRDPMHFQYATGY